MEIIERIINNGKYNIKKLNDEYDTNILTKPFGIGVSDIVIHRNSTNNEQHDFKIVIAPELEDENQKSQICEAFLSTLHNELVTHGDMYASLKDTPISLYVIPHVFASAVCTSEEQMYLIYQLTSSALRVMNNHTGILPESGLLH